MMHNSFTSAWLGEYSKKIQMNRCMNRTYEHCLRHRLTPNGYKKIFVRQDATLIEALNYISDKSDWVLDLDGDQPHERVVYVKDDSMAVRFKMEFG